MKIEMLLEINQIPTNRVISFNNRDGLANRVTPTARSKRSPAS